jgi:hypothetical protein
MRFEQTIDRQVVAQAAGVGGNLDRGHRETGQPAVNASQGAGLLEIMVRNNDSGGGESTQQGRPAARKGFEFQVNLLAAGTRGGGQQLDLLFNCALKEAAGFGATTGGNHLRGVQAHQHLMEATFQVVRVLKVIQTEFICQV